MMRPKILNQDTGRMVYENTPTGRRVIAEQYGGYGNQQYGGLSLPFKKNSQKGQVISGPMNVQKGKLTTDPTLYMYARAGLVGDDIRLKKEIQNLKTQAQTALQNKDFAKAEQLMAALNDIEKRANKLAKEEQAFKGFSRN